MEKPMSSFWGSISYVGQVVRKGQVQVVVSIESSRVHIREDDPAIPYLKVTSGGKRAFIIFEPIDVDGLCRVVAVYGHRKADHRLVLAIRETLQLERSTLRDLADWDPDYLYIPPKKS
jgi:hypothetical protein